MENFQPGFSEINHKQNHNLPSSDFGDDDIFGELDPFGETEKVVNELGTFEVEQRLLQEEHRNLADDIFFNMDFDAREDRGYEAKPGLKFFPDFSDYENTPTINPSSLLNSIQLPTKSLPDFDNEASEEEPAVSASGAGEFYDSQMDNPSVQIPVLFPTKSLPSAVDEVDKEKPAISQKAPAARIPTGVSASGVDEFDKLQMEANEMEPAISQKASIPKIPSGVSESGAVSISDFYKFLKANGQDAQQLDIFGTTVDISDNIENFTSSLISTEQGEQLVMEEGVSWNFLKSITIITPTQTFKNVWANRLCFGGREATHWQQAVRRAAIEKAGWDYDQLRKYEAEQKNGLHPIVLNWIDRQAEQKFDSDVRLWIYLNTQKVWDPTRLSNKSLTESTYDAMFVCPNLSDATPYNNFFLRFYDYSPVFPFRNLQTGIGLKALCIDIKHTISGAKSNVIKKLRKSMPTGHGGMLYSELTGRERKWLKSFVNTSPKRLGFRTYTKQPEVRARVNSILEQNEDEERAKCTQEGIEYIPIDTFSQREKIKLDLWSRLSQEEKEKWRILSKDTPDADEMTDEERVHLAQKLLVRAAEALAGSVGMHVMIYSSYMCNDEPYSTSIECGESPYGKPFHETQHAMHHKQMKKIFCDGAALRAGTDPARVRESFIPRIAALELADRDMVDTEDADPVPVITIPSLTFDAKEIDMNTLAKKMEKWFKLTVEAVYGRKLRSTGDFSMKFLCRRQNSYFENFPLDVDNKPVRLAEFGAMQDDHLVIWRDHLIASFSAKPCLHPFRFKTGSRAPPQLTMLKMGKKSHDSVTKIKKVGGKSKGKEVKKRGRSRQKHGNHKDVESQSEEEESMTDGSVTYSEEEEGDPHDLPVRSKVPRKSAEHAMVYIGKHAKREAVYDEQQSSKRTKRRNAIVMSPSHRRALPGSEEQRRKKRDARLSAGEEIGFEDKPIPPSPSSLYLQTKDMKTSTLPDSWRRRSFDENTVMDSLQQNFDVLIRSAPCGVALRDPHKSLHPLWSDIEKQSSNRKPFAHKSLFDWLAANFISHAALNGSALLPTWSDSLPPFPLTVEGQYCNTIGVLLQMLDDTSAAVPAHFKTFHGSLPEDLYIRLTSVTVEWIEACLRKMSTPAAMRATSPEQKQLLKIVRCLAFLYSVNPSSTLLEGHGIYRKLISILGARCINNYVSLVLKPLVVSIETELGRKRQRLGALVARMVAIVNLWASTFPDFAASVCELGDFFRGNFPNILLGSAEADALDWVLRHQFWCCTSATDFPMLIVSSREHSLTDILQKMSLRHHWSEWTLFDKFCCLVVTLAAAVPFLNTSTTTKSGTKFETARKISQQHLGEFMIELESYLLEDSKSFDMADIASSPKVAEGKLSNLPVVSDWEDEEEVHAWQGFGRLNATLDQVEREDEDRGRNGVEGGRVEGENTGGKVREDDLFPEELIPKNDGSASGSNQRKRKKQEVNFSSDEEREDSPTPQVRRSPRKNRQDTPPRKAQKISSVNSQSELRRSPRKTAQKPRVRFIV